MENYDLLASLNVKASTTGSSKRGIVIGSGPSTPIVRDDKSSISAIVALRQSQNDTISSGPLRVNRHTSRNQLIGILTENNANGRSATRKKTFCIEPKLHRAGIVGNVVQVQLQRGGDGTSTIADKIGIHDGNATGKQKIPRPANAFMLFANEWRKKLAIENPRESNKDISVRLGVLWKNMDKDVKEKYFALAREVDAEHKRKYPDYVYNPKEARLRKAMREQSRELSRQTILQTAIASATGNTSVGGPGCGSNGVGDNISPSPGTGTTNFLNHPLNCSASVAAATLSSLPGSPSFNAGNRIINPWFPGAHGPSTNHPKPILSPRVMTVAQHHQQQQQQQHRTFDKTKEVLRKQAECAGSFTAASNPGYPTDFSTHGNPGNHSGHQSSPHETNDYCVIAEFSDGQKWHPYQNGPSPYHSRPGGTLAKMGALHPSMQSTNQHTHTGWNQFCTVPLSTVGRTPRHMVFLQEPHQSQHCGFTDEMQMPYMQNKHMDISRRLHPGYSQQEHQSSKLQPSSMSPLNMSQLREPEKTIEDGPRWESSGGGSPGTSENSMVSMMRARRDNELKLHQEQEHEQARAQQQDCRQHSKNREQQQQQQHQQHQQHQQRYSDEQSSSSSSSSNGSETTMKHHTNKPGGTKQPLPGFHQAFGSTEIGRFSRSEFFANMVGGDGTINVSNNIQNSCNSSTRIDDRSIDIVDNGVGDELIEDSTSSPASSSNNVIIDNCKIHRVRTNSASSRSNWHNRRLEEANIDDCHSQSSINNNENTSNVAIDRGGVTSFNDSLATGTNYYNDARSPGPSGDSAIVGVATMPRWHSPYVSAIGSEI